MKMIKILPAITASLFERNKCHLLTLCLFALGLTPPFGGGLSEVEAQNIGISTDASAPETGLMLDIKMPSGYPKTADNAAQPFFQIKSFDADASALKLRMGLRTHSAPANRYAFLEFLEAGTPTYLPLALQPSGGNVGIGTTNPANIFHLYGASSPAVILDGLAGNARMYQLRTSGIARWVFGANATAESGSNAGSDFQIISYNDAGAGLVNALTIKRSDGNVGIGFTNPAALLSVAGNAIFGGANAIENNASVSVQAMKTSGQSLVSFRQGTFGAGANGSNSLIIINDNGDATSSIAQFVGAGSERMRVTSSGNVGIGTTTPTHPLEIVSSMAVFGSTPLIRTWSTAGGVNSKGFQIQNNSGDFYFGSTNDDWSWKTTVMTMLGNGNVGIGTTTPATKLDVYGINTGFAQSNAGGMIFQTQDGLGRPAISTYGNIDGIPANGTASALVVRQVTGTGRSISAAGTINASGADYAEYFCQEVPGTLQRGDVACLCASGNIALCKPDDGKIIGVVSTKPGVVGNDIFDAENPDHTALIGLMGQVPVNVTVENGEIEVGDYLTVSASLPGYAMKATGAVPVIGVALESLRNKKGKVTAFLYTADGYTSAQMKALEQENKNLHRQLSSLKADYDSRLKKVEDILEEKAAK